MQIIDVTLRDGGHVREFNWPFKYAIDHYASLCKISDIKLIEVGKDVVFDFELVQDDTEDWSIFLETKDFKFAPANIGEAHVLGEGYAYLFIDGVKHSRIYSNWHHLGPLKYGSEIRITLNSNDHRTYSKKGMPVERVYILENNKEN